MKKALATLITIAMAVSSVGCSKSDSSDKNETSETEITSDINDISCSMRIEVTAFGYTESGDNLADNWVDELIINANDTICETYQGHWVIDNDGSSELVMMTIVSIDDSGVVILKDGVKSTLEYQHEYEFDSEFQAMDGQNYEYLVEFTLDQ